jgi:thiol-disulfide isomerase/thioredoxin
MRFRNCIASVSLFVPTMLVLALGGLILPTAYGAQSPGSNQASHLYFFTNDGCAPCRQVEPSIEALHREGYPVTTIKISEQPEVADRFHVDRTPTVVLVTGNQITGRHAGQISLPTLREWFAAVGQRPVAIAKTKPRPNAATTPRSRCDTRSGNKSRHWFRQSAGWLQKCVGPSHRSISEIQHTHDATRH